MENVTLKVKDLACPDCAKKIGEVLKKKQGVADAEVSFMTGNLKLAYDPDAISIEEVKKTVAKLGYEVV